MHRSLVSLSVVTAMWDQRRHDYLDNFVPFIATLLESQKIRRIENDDVFGLCQKFEDEFGLKIPHHPMLTVLHRCVRRKLLQRSDRGYTAVDRVVGDMSFSRTRNSFVRREEELLKKFVEYVKTTFDRDIDVEDAETALLDYMGRYDMEILVSNTDQSAIPHRPRSKHNKQLSYMLSRFAIDAHGSSPEIFDTLSDIALGNMLTAAVLVDGYDWPSDTVRGANIYLDSPIILRMIGTAGESQATAFCNFVSQLRASGSKLWIFEHSRREAMQILDGARYWVFRPGFDPKLASRTAIFFRQQGYTESEIERFILRVDAVLSEHHIDVFDRHPYMENKVYQVDESHIQRTIESCYTSSNTVSGPETNEDGILKDVASIAAVCRLRAGSRPVLLRDAKHVFVSLNGALSRASKIALCDQTIQEIPACITDVFLGTILWINAPHKARDASRIRLIADCYSAVAPDRELEAGIVREAVRLRDQNRISEDDFLLLTTSFVTRDLLSEKTLNDPDALDSSTSFEILEGIKDRIRRRENGLRAKVELEREKEQRARERAEQERDTESKRFERIVDDRARSRAILVNALYAACGVIVFLVAPIVGAIVATPWAMVATGVGTVGAYIGHLVGISPKSNYDRLVAKYRSLFSAKYADE